MTVAHYVLLGRTAHLGPLGRETQPRPRPGRRGPRPASTSTASPTARLDTLSGGERQRAVLARGLAQEATLLFLDEPTDRARHRATSRRRSSSSTTCAAALGLTVVSTMHDLTLAAQYADHLVLLADGPRRAVRARRCRC